MNLILKRIKDIITTLPKYVRKTKAKMQHGENAPAASGFIKFRSLLKKKSLLHISEYLYVAHFL